MVFSSLLFLFRFLPLMLIFYFIFPRKYRNLVLFTGSLIFYAWGEPIYVLLMIFSTLVDYILGLLTSSYKKNGNIKKARIFVVLSIIINLSLLCFFKYSGFIINNINSLFNINIKWLDLSLPIGISFYTFQTMSYTIDIYRGEAEPQKNIIDFGTYVALFPQLIAGPIVQYKTIAKQLKDRKDNIHQFSYGVMRFIIGLGKKVLLANNIGLLWNEIYSKSLNEISIVTGWFGIIAFSLQIYFDFSGYSDMAIGLGNIFGFRFLENFNYPYTSKSITEFWRRWHISLGTWFKEYVYFPLGGSRTRQVRNIMVVWLLTGVWHGAGWNFIIWGLYFGFILILEKKFLLRILKKLPDFCRRIYSILFILIGFTIFAIDDIAEGIEYLKVMFGFAGNPILDREGIYFLYTNLILLIILIVGSTEIPKNIIKKLSIKKSENKIGPFFMVLGENIFIIAIFLLSVAYLVDASYNPFLYFRF